MGTLLHGLTSILLYLFYLLTSRLNGFLFYL